MLESSYWSRNLKRRPSRRRALRIAGMGGVGLAAAALVACKAEEKKGPTTLAGKSGTDFGLTGDLANAKYGGTLVIRQGDLPIGLDPHQGENPATHSFSQPCYDSLVRRPENPAGTWTGSYEPRLATSWENPEPTRWVFKLQKGVKFQEPGSDFSDFKAAGREFKAEDAKYSYERIRDGGGTFRIKDLYAPMKFETPDNETLVVRLDYPLAPFMEFMAHQWAAIVPRELVEAKGEKNIDTWPAGTGPFILTSHQTGQEIRFRRNPNYWKKGFPFVDEVVIKVILDAPTFQAAFLADEVDFGGSDDRATRQALTQARPNLKFTKVPGWYVGKLYFDLSNRNSPWAKDKRMRQALWRAYPTKAILDSQGVECCFSGIYPSHVKPWALPESEFPAFDVAEAIKLFTAAGYAPGTEIPLDITTSEQYAGRSLAEALAGVFANLNKSTSGAFNVKVNVKILEVVQWIKEVYRAGSQFMATTHVDWVFDDPGNGLNRYFHSKGVANATHFSNPEVDRLLEQQLRELDQQKRVQLVHEVQRKLIDEAPQIFTFSPDTFYTSQDWVKNYVPMIKNQIELYRWRDTIWLGGGPRGPK